MYTYALIGEMVDKTRSTSNDDEPEVVTIFPFLNDSNEQDYLLLTAAMKYLPWLASHGDKNTAWKDMFEDLKKIPDRNGTFTFQDANYWTTKNRITSILNLEEKWFEKVGVDRVLKTQKDGTMKLVSYDDEDDDFYMTNDGTNYGGKIRALAIEMMNATNNSKMKKEAQAAKKPKPDPELEKGQTEVLTTAATKGSTAWKSLAVEHYMTQKKRPKKGEDEQADPIIVMYPEDDEEKKPTVVKREKISLKKSPPGNESLERSILSLRDNQAYKHEENMKKIEVVKVREEKDKLRLEYKLEKAKVKKEKMRQATLQLEIAAKANNNNM